MKNTIHHILSSIFIIGLLISFIGIPVDDHYCGDSFISTTIGLPVHDQCGDMPMDEDCCKDEIVIFSITDFFNYQNTDVVQKTVSTVLECDYNLCHKLIPRTLDTEVLVEHHPPSIESKIFVKIQSFLL